MYQVRDERINKALRQFVMELMRAESLHPIWPENTLRETAIVAGEAGEALQAALHHAEGRGDKEAVEQEIVQTGAMCLRWLINQ